MRKKHSKKRRDSNSDVPLAGTAKIGGDIVTSAPPADWSSAFDALDRAGMPSDFMADRDMSLPQERDNAQTDAGEMVDHCEVMKRVKKTKARKS